MGKEITKEYFVEVVGSEPRYAPLCDKRYIKGRNVWHVNSQPPFVDVGEWGDDGISTIFMTKCGRTLIGESETANRPSGRVCRICNR
jgi:hypothetical protein